MMKNIFLLFISLILILGCSQKENKPSKTDPKTIPLTANEKYLQNTSDDFSKMCGEKGLVEAFKNFAADDVILMREGTVPVSGIDSIIAFLSKRKEIKTLKTQASKIRVASGNDLGYVVGKWNLILTGKNGLDKSMDGHYTSVWHKQSDSLWKFELFCMTSNYQRTEKQKDK